MPTEKSMGNPALEQTATLIVNEDKTAVVELSFKSLTYSGKNGYLGFLKKVNGDGSLTEATVLETYDELDQYNDPDSDSVDPNVEGIKYPKRVSIPVEVEFDADDNVVGVKRSKDTSLNGVPIENANDVHVQVYVPVMEEILAGGGTKDAYLRFNGAMFTGSSVSLGIVGESGCGKSTIASLLMGRNTIKSGNLTIGGKNINQISELSLMQNLTYISHNSTFFKGTVKENLLLGNPKASDSDLWSVLDRCNLSAFLKSEKGLDTVLTENAGNLSGGQKQRLALARAILHDSPVYIFDEATSNIDVESEEVILTEIRRLSQKKTVIMISHRLANVVSADCIYALENGSIAESGTHQDLLNYNNIYAKLWKTQEALEQFGKEATA